MTTGAGSFQHEALLYRTPGEFAGGVLPFILGGLAAGEPVLVAVPARQHAIIRQGLGAGADAVRFVDMSDAGRNPGRIIPGVLHPFIDAHAGHCRVVGEPVWPGRATAEYPACVQHESLINVAFEGRQATVLCPYDVARLPAYAIADAGRTHPVLLDGPGRRVSPDYLPPTAAADVFNQPPAEPPGEWTGVTFGVDGLAGVRRLVAAEGERAGLSPERNADLQLAVNEVATNAVTHAGGVGTLRVWRDADGLVCELSDMGHGMHRLAGRIPPGRDSEGGRGLILVNHLCDLVHIYAGNSHNTVRLHMRRDGQTGS
ncbi:MAG TPA: sensor histidine kinase [Pilimelia sp.]|nr:sensor histidine kinase [Pilimelia sp.]